MSGEDIRAELATLRAELATLRAEVRPRPVTSWRGVAAVVGVSEDTVARRRRVAGDRSRAWFSDESAVHEWWRELHVAPVAPPPPRRRQTTSSKPARTVALRARDLLTP